MGDDNTGEVLNIFFSNIVRKRKNEGYSSSDDLPAITISILLQEKSTIKTESYFSFSKILTDILKSETAEACQDTNFYENLQKNGDIFADVFTSNFNSSIENPNFSSILKKCKHDNCI